MPLKALFLVLNYFARCRCDIDLRSVLVIDLVAKHMSGELRCPVTAHIVWYICCCIWENDYYYMCHTLLMLHLHIKGETLKFAGNL